MTSGFNGSPADTHSRSDRGAAPRSDWIRIRQTVGGAQNVVTPHRSIASRRGSAENRR